MWSPTNTDYNNRKRLLDIWGTEAAILFTISHPNIVKVLPNPISFFFSTFVLHEHFILWIFLLQFPTIPFQLSISNYPFPTIHFQLSISNFPSPTIHFQLSISNYPFPTILFQLSISSFLPLSLNLHNFLNLSDFQVPYSFSNFQFSFLNFPISFLLIFPLLF